MKSPIYLDNHATTPLDPAALQAMMPYFTDYFGNVASGHGFGIAVRKPVANARRQLANLISADEKNIVFTSGATESNNLAIKGIALGQCALGKHIITSSIEHKSVLETCHFLEGQGFEVTILPVDAEGTVDPRAVESALRNGQAGTVDRTTLVSIMAANNEIGTIQDIKEISLKIRDNGAFFHVDAAQAVGKIPINVDLWDVDLLSFTAHKMYGPKGIGALYLDRERCCNMAVQIHGGGQESGMRSGTLPVPLIVGFGTAAAVSEMSMAEEKQRMDQLRKKLIDCVITKFPSIKLNGHPERRLPGNIHLSFPDVCGETLMIDLRSLAISTTSACSSARDAQSHVLKAIGLPDDLMSSSIRIGIGRFNTEDDIEFAIHQICAALDKQCLKMHQPRIEKIVAAVRDL